MIDMGVDVDTILYSDETFSFMFHIMECKLEFQWNYEKRVIFAYPF